MLHRKFLLQLLVLLVAAIVSTASIADHSWGKFKWKPSSIPFNLNLGDNVDSSWDGHLLSASTDWSVSTVLGTTVISGSTDPISCSPESGNIQVCNAAYGNTGWLGIAQIYGRGTTITAGVIKVNDTYYNTAYYNTPAWRQVVMCQEIAHTFGLAHQDETFDNVNLGTCMDYTDDPDGSIDDELSNISPNQHDYDQLASMYATDDGGGGGGGCNPKSKKCNQASAAGGHAQWGQLVSGHGGTEIYERSLGGGRKVITFVTWTLEHADS
ncbi:MAG: hypothetical protein V3R51_06660, partial [Gammaproteobacteria bacterium]